MNKQWKIALAVMVVGVARASWRRATAWSAIRPRAVRRLPSTRSPLALATAVAGERPDNLIQVLLQGKPLEMGRPTGQASRYMPPFASALNDAQIAALAAYVRVEIAKRPAWPDVEQRAASLRKAAL